MSSFWGIFRVSCAGIPLLTARSKALYMGIHVDRSASGKAGWSCRSAAELRKKIPALSPPVIPHVPIAPRLYNRRAADYLSTALLENPTDGNGVILQRRFYPFSGLLGRFATSLRLVCLSNRKGKELLQIGQRRFSHSNVHKHFFSRPSCPFFL